MSLKERGYSILVVSCSEKFNTAFSEMFSSSKYQPIHITTSANEAKRCIFERSFDFVIINLPLPDELGIRLAIDCCRIQTSVVLVLSKSDIFAEICDKAVDNGIFALQKPISKATLIQALTWMAAARERLGNLEKKTLSVEERMEEIRIINRAKCVLISELKMTEPDAHHYLEKYAMDNCISKKDAANCIIKIYT